MRVADQQVGRLRGVHAIPLFGIDRRDHASGGSSELLLGPLEKIGLWVNDENGLRLIHRQWGELRRQPGGEGDWMLFSKWE